MKLSIFILLLVVFVVSVQGGYHHTKGPVHVHHHVIHHEHEGTGTGGSQGDVDSCLPCPKNEVFSECEAHCQKNCTNWNKPIFCPKKCVKGCVCAKGLVRGQDGKCILPKQCPGKNICPKGEHYDQCNTHCQRNCNNWGRPLVCPLMCVHGCVCDLGTVRGPKGKCIKPNQCPKKSVLESSIESSAESTEQDFASAEDVDEIVCPKYEHLSDCSAHCQKNCTNFNKPMPCPYICVKGCVCDEGYVRGKNGKCVKPEQCPVRDVCPRGEHFDMCQAHCQKNCINWDKPLVCPFMCVKGCVCNRGTVRGPHGRCIKVDKCPRRSFAESQEQGVSITEGLPVECTFEKEVGPCRAQIPRYFFSQETRQCEKFFFGGCEGNENNFLSRQACVRKCQKIAEPESAFISEEEIEVVGLPVECTLEKEVGPCRANIPRYFFNQETRQCERFFFGGCEGNENNFLSRQACVRKCQKTSRSSAEMSSQEESEVQAEGLPTECTVEKEVGPCRAQIPRYFFNQETRQCEKFFFGGCEGNENNFVSRQDCVRKCQKSFRSSAEISSQEESEVQAEELPTECFLEEVTGPCRGYFPRYYFNKETNKCEQFIYGGCEGNENNFESKSHCERKCHSGSRSSAEISSQEESEVQAEELPSECFLEKVKGPCNGYFPRYYFNKKTNTCEQFIYGGCEGNENNFESKMHCERKCHSELPTECTLEKVEGPCYAHISRYFFNKETNKCEQFIYGGCRGNENNFESKMHCERKCMLGSSSPTEMNSEETREVQSQELPTECTLEKKVGPCRGRFTRYYFNKETNKCEEFFYGGCLGNQNNFWTKAHCERKCLIGSTKPSDLASREESEFKIEDDLESSDVVWHSEESQALPRECTLAKKIGPCKGSYPRFFFNKATNQCEHFIFGGCQGNENNFETKEECENKCSKSELY